MKPTNEIIKERQRIVLRSAGGEMTAKAFCNDHIRRGWAYPEFTPAQLDFEDTDVLKLFSPLLNLN